MKKKNAGSSSKDNSLNSHPMIGNFNAPGFGSLKMQSGKSNQIGTQFNEISAGFRMIG